MLMSIGRHKAGLMFGVCCAAMISAVGAKASAQESASDEGQVETIVVTANRRAENIQSVPIAVSAISATTAERRGITDFPSIANSVPGLRIDRGLSSSSPYLRGVGAPGATPSFEPSIATYIDNVYIPTSAATIFEFNSLERVEVLKGPQGTLFGRNASGGVIHVFTKDPTERPELDVSVGYGNYNTLTGNLYATSRIFDKLSANISLHARNQGKGWGTNLFSGEDVYKGSDYAALVKVLWTPGDNTRVLFRFDVDNAVDDAGTIRGILPGTFVPNPPGPPLGNQGFYNVNNSFEGHHVLVSENASMQLEQDLGFAKFVSISAYRHLRVHYRYDIDLAPANSTEVYVTPPNDMFSQELQLRSADSSRISWILGTFFYKNQTGYQPLEVVLASGRNVTKDYVNSWSIAGFGQATVPVLESTNLTLGARYTVDHRTISGSVAFNGVQTATNASSSQWPKATFRVALDHKINDDLMVFASYNTGFKSGIYDVSALTRPAANPETLKAYEVGIKSDWLARRLRVNASLFRYNYDNLQVKAIIAGPPISSYTVNAGNAKIQGADIEITAAPTAHLTLNAGIEVLETTFRTFKGGVHFSPAPLVTCANVPFPPGSPGGQVQVNNGGAGCDLSGNELPNAPPFTFNVGATYEIPTSHGDWSLSAGYFYTSRYFAIADNSIKIEAYGLLNASLGWTSPTGKWGATIWGKNLTDEKYYSFADSSNFGKYYSAGEPLTFGITLRAHLE